MSNKKGDIEKLADEIASLLDSRALSIGLVDIAVSVDELFIDCELIFATAPDMGISVDTQQGAALYCMLIGVDSEQWLDHTVTNLLDINSESEQALKILDGLLDARRPLLKKN